MEETLETINQSFTWMGLQIAKTVFISGIGIIAILKLKNDWIGFFEDIKKLIEFILKVILFLPRIIKKKIKRRRAWKNS